MSEQPVTFQRLYEHGSGPEHPVSPGVVERVLHSMNNTAGLNPFRVRFRFSDGRLVIAAPKKGAK